MIRRSLRWRLLSGAAVATFLALLAAWIGMTLLFARHVERTALRDMASDGKQLIAELTFAADGAPVIEEPLRDPRFDLPASGRYWQLTSPAGNRRSRSLWDQTLPAPDTPLPERHWHSRYADGPNGERVFLVEREVQPEQHGPRVLVQVANEEVELRAAKTTFARELAAFLGLLWAALVAGAWAQVHLGLRPLARIREDLAALRRSPAVRLDASHPREIHPLTDAINALADAREKDLVRARRRAADLAHSLKTPLAALSAQSRRAREAGATDAADGLDRAIATAAAAIEAELARSRAADIRARDAVGESDANQVAERIVGVVERTERGATLVFQVDIPDRERLPIATDDLTELLGALVENAARFAKRRVRISTARTQNCVAIRVEDDGTGLDIAAEQALARGGRLDEAAHAHHGLGLSIVRELVDATGGQLSLQRSNLGGLVVEAAWPLT